MLYKSMPPFSSGPAGSNKTSWQLSQRALAAGGQPIALLMHRALARADLISLAAGFVDQDTLPRDEVQRACESLMAETKDALASLQYGTTPGDEGLRDLLIQRLAAADGTSPIPLGWTVDRVFLTAGSNQLLHLVAESLLNPGDIVLCAAPTYFVFLGMLRNLQARGVGVATDEYGIIPNAVEQELRYREKIGELRRVKAIYVVSYSDNPAATTLPRERRQALFDVARRYKLHLIEDMAYRDLRFEGDDPPSMASLDTEGETVVLMGTFSKSFSPGMRVGWGLLPRHLTGPVCNQKANIDFGSPHFNQRLMERVLRMGLLDSHIARLLPVYRGKLEAMLQALQRDFGSMAGCQWHRPQGGLYVWLTFPPGLCTGPTEPLFEAALEEGVLYVPGEYCYPCEGIPVAKNTIRLSYGTASPARIGEGIAALRGAVRRVE